jgi:hypothetical protein
VGYDRKLYTDGFVLLDEDVGYVDIRLPGIVAKIEIKATRASKISMSYQQGREAAKDRDAYWLCVVPLPDPVPDDRPLLETVRDCVRFVPRVGDTLASSYEELNLAQSTAMALGFELEHVDQVRYCLANAIWEQTVSPSKISSRT